MMIGVWDFSQTPWNNKCIYSYVVDNPITLSRNHTDEHISVVSMGPTQGAEIENSHVPLAFLLGRRASEYDLPTLNQVGYNRQDTTALFTGKAHARRREEQAKKLLERVLEKEYRVDKTKPRYQADASLEAPLARISTADRRQRTIELQRVLEEDSTAERKFDLVEKRNVVADNQTLNHSDLHDQRHHYASTYGFVLEKVDFVEVVGTVVRIQRAQSLRHFHEDANRTSSKLLKAKQTHLAKMTEHLQTQQTETKTRLREVEQSLNKSQKRAGIDPPVSMHEVNDVDQELSNMKRWQGERQHQLNIAKEAEQGQLQQRHEAVQRARRDAETSIKARLSSSRYEKKLMAKIKGVGPSYLSTLRVDAATVGSEDPVQFEQMQKTQLRPPDKDLTNAPETLTTFDHLLDLQYEKFIKSQTRTLHLGGGFASKPGGSSANADDVDSYTNEIRTLASAVPLEKTRREVIDEWRRRISGQ